MDKHSLEQQFHKSVAATILCEKNGAIALAQPGLMAGSSADEMLLHLEIVKITYWMKIGNLSAFRKVQCNYSGTNIF